MMPVGFMILGGVLCGLSLVLLAVSQYLLFRWRNRIEREMTND